MRVTNTLVHFHAYCPRPQPQAPSHVASLTPPYRIPAAKPRPLLPPPTHRLIRPAPFPLPISPAPAPSSLPPGGVYIAGGITPKLLPRIQAGSLLEGFLMRKGRAPFVAILKDTPLFVITNDKVGQIGAREYAKRLLCSP